MVELLPAEVMGGPGKQVMECLLSPLKFDRASVDENLQSLDKLLLPAVNLLLAAYEMEHDEDLKEIAAANNIMDALSRTVSWLFSHWRFPHAIVLGPLGCKRVLKAGSD